MDFGSGNPLECIEGVGGGGGTSGVTLTLAAILSIPFLEYLSLPLLGFKGFRTVVPFPVGELHNVSELDLLDEVDPGLDVKTGFSIPPASLRFLLKSLDK